MISTTEPTSIRTALLERIRSERAERHAQQVDIYYPDPSFEFMANLVHWKMEKTAVADGSIESLTAGFTAIQSILNSCQALVDDAEIGAALATITALAIRTVIDLGIYDDAVIENWDEVINVPQNDCL